MKNIAILGSTGSIGSSALKVINDFPGEFRVRAVSANSNIGLLLRQIKKFRPRFACVNDPLEALKLKSLASLGTKVLAGADGLKVIVQDREIDLVLLAISGSSALGSLLDAIDAGKDVCLANKEALVMAGPIIMKKAARKKVKIIPIDSEQSAIWQCLEGEEKQKLKSIYLTASGGPFRKARSADLKKVTIKHVLNHPRWRMGKKITVDSASLMNKGLELIEAMYLFGVTPDRIKVLVHPEAIIHSMVEFIDGVVVAQLSVTDMRIPIQYALSYPERLPNRLKGVDFIKVGSLNFENPDYKRFPCLKLAYRAARESGTSPCILNAANEISVDEFLKGRLSFADIPGVISRVMSRHRNISSPGLEDIREKDAWARREAIAVIKMKGK